MERQEMTGRHHPTKETLVECFTPILGVENLTDELLSKTVKKRTLGFYEFYAGQIHVSPVFPNVQNTLQECLYDLYVYAEPNVSQETRTLLKQTYPLNEYMTACVFISLIRACSVIVKEKGEPFSAGPILKEIIDAHTWWVEKMFTEHIHVNKILLALTFDVFIDTQQQYESFRDDIRNLPEEWLKAYYKTTFHTSW